MKCSDDNCNNPARVKVEFAPPLPMDSLFGLQKSVRALCESCLQEYNQAYTKDLKVLMWYE